MTDAEQTGTSAQMLAKIQIAADDVVTRVNEWTDRTSPEDFPEALLITSSELHRELMRFAEDIGALNRTAASDAARAGADAVALADQLWEALKVQCASTPDKSKVKTLVTVSHTDVVAAVAALAAPQPQAGASNEW